MAAVRIAFLVVSVACAFVLLVNAQSTPDDDSPTNPSSERTISIESSNAPDIQYEWDAVECLTEAYILHPDTLDTVIAAFGELYRIKHKGMWDVAAGCSYVYTPKHNVTMVVKVSEGSDDTLITLYN